jgi:putative Ca2+/H+ antiporter (TMEM165/GDT1 family)
VESIINSSLLVALSEMGDKTQLLAFSLATRFKKPVPILAGILAATLFNHALASSLGSWISTHVSTQILAGILGLTFIAFGIWTLKPDQYENRGSTSTYGAFWTTAILFFLAEMGDKTQLATVALAAKYQNATFVTIGTTIGMMASDGLAVFLGEKLAEKVSMEKIRWAAAGLFFIFGVVSLVTFFSASST